MKKRLCLKRKRQNQATRKKWATFLFAFSIFYFHVSVVKASSPASTSRTETAQTITVSATVPLTPEFVYLIRKNSEVLLSKKSFSVGEESVIRVVIKGGNHEVLRNHRVVLEVVDAKKEGVASFSGVTDAFGSISFSLQFTKKWLGKKSVIVSDRTYKEPVWLIAEESFTVYETQDAREKTEKNMERGITSSQDMVERENFDRYVQVQHDFLEKNGTMRMYQSERIFETKPP